MERSKKHVGVKNILPVKLFFVESCTFFELGYREIPKAFNNFQISNNKNMATITVVSLTAEQVSSIETRLAEIRQEMPFLVGLSSRDRMKLNPIGSKSTQFVQRVVESIRQNPEMSPQFVDAQNLEKGFELYNQLGSLQTQVGQLEQMIADTMLTQGSSTFGSALDFYNSAKRAVKSGIPGAQTIVDTLKPRFRKTRRKVGDGSNADTSGGAVT